VPSFSSRAESLSFFGAWDICWLEFPINVAVRDLAICQSLISLTIRSILGVSLDLEVISLSCPSLKHLRLSHIDEYTGTLDRLVSLEVMCVNSCIVEKIPGSSLIPLRSAASLTHLAVIFGRPCNWRDDVDREFWPRKDYYNGLGAFVNLKSIHIHPLTDGLYDFLFRTTIKLKELRTTVIKKHGMASLFRALDLFSKPSLGDLSSLCLVVEDHVEWRSSYRSLAERIAMKLTGIEDIVLSMGMDVTWLPMFTNLRYLKRLMWHVPGHDGSGDDWSASTLPLIPNDWDLLALDHYRDSLLWKDTGFLQKFRSAFNEMPSIKVKILEDSSGIVGECHGCPPFYNRFWAPNIYEECYP
jgi:hypothetical protein